MLNRFGHCTATTGQPRHLLQWRRTPSNQDLALESVPHTFDLRQQVR